MVGTERMRIDSSGNVGIGTGSPAFKVDISGGGTTAKINTLDTHDGGASLSTWMKVGRRAGTGTNAYINTLHSGSDAVSALTFAFGTTGTGTEAARIDSSGNLLVGTTSASSSRLNVIKGDATGPVIRAESTSGSFTGSLFEGYGNRTTTNGSYVLIDVLNGNNTGRFKVLDSGNAQNTNNSYGSISDIKLKENIVDATPKLEKLNQVRIVNFNLIGSEQKQLGVIAQELEQIFPGMVEDSPDRDAEGNDLGTTTKAVKYSVFVPMLVKAIQEQQAIIVSLQDTLTALTTRITALEGAAA